MTRLGDLRPGDGGVVSRMPCDGHAAQRLMELGLIEGAEVRVVRAAPLGDPIEITIHGHALSLRRGDVKGVEIT